MKTTDRYNLEVVKARMLGLITESEANELLKDRHRGIGYIKRFIRVKEYKPTTGYYYILDETTYCSPAGTPGGASQKTCYGPATRSAYPRT